MCGDQAGALGVGLLREVAAVNEDAEFHVEGKGVVGEVGAEIRRTF